MIANIHTHSEYSFLGSLLPVERIVGLSKLHGYDAVSISDTVSTFGFFKLTKYCEAENLKPIYGIELFIKTPEKEVFPILLFAQNNEGLKNIFKLNSFSHAHFNNKGKYFIDIELIKEYSKGLIAIIEKEILFFKDDFKTLREIIERYKKIFDDNFFIEINYTGARKVALIKELINIVEHFSLSAIPSCETRYEKDDKNAFDFLNSMREKSFKKNEKGSFLDISYDYSFRERVEFEKIFKNHPDYIENLTNLIKSINVDLDLKSPKTFKINFEKSLREICYEKLNDFTKENKIKNKKSYEERLEYELKIIEEKNFTDFFLLSFEIVSFLKKEKIAYGPARGSSASSLVLFLLEVTKIDPIKHDLLFERFLNPARVELPDIDMDICWKKRQLLFDFLFQKYKNHTAHLATIKRFFPYALINELSKHFNLPKDKIKNIKKFFPPQTHFSVKDLLIKNEEFLTLYSGDKLIREFIDILLKMEGLAVHSSIHAGGVVITPLELNEYFSLEITRDGNPLAEITKDDLEESGFIKIDILGLRYVSIISETMKKLKINKISLKDKKTFELLSSGDTIGVFQLESYGMRELLRRIKPDSIQILSDVIALYRPGPLISGMTDVYCKRRNQKNFEITNKIDELLKDTNGIFIYQEQILKFLTKIAQFDWSKADIFRKALSKKDIPKIISMKEEFIKGLLKNNFSEEEAKKFFSIIVDFGSYSFNKAHSVAYAYNAYLCAYLKTHYPIDYYINLLNNHIGFNSKLERYIFETKEKGIKILPLDINKSHVLFKKEENGIRSGLIFIKFVRYNLATKIIKERKNGEFKDLFDFCFRMKKHINIRNTQYLILSGCFDYLGIPRKTLLTILPEIFKTINNIYQDKEKGANELFPIEKQLSISEFIKDEIITTETENERHYMEYKALDIHLTFHPFEAKYNKVRTLNLDKIEYVRNLKYGVIAGWVEKIKFYEREKNSFFSFIVSDETGSIKCFVSGEIIKHFNTSLEKYEIYLLKGNVKNGTFFVNEIYKI